MLIRPLPIAPVAPATVAGMLVGVTYLAGPLPFYLTTARAMVPGSDVALSGFVVAFLTAGFVTIALAVVTRQPVAVGWSMPGLIYLAAATQDHTPAALAGAGLVSGIVILAFAVTGMAEKLGALVPLPVVLAVLAASALPYCMGIFPAVSVAPMAAGLPVVAFFAARQLRFRWLPPLGAAVLSVIPLLCLQGHAGDAGTGLALPPLIPVVPVIDWPAIVSLAPLLVLASISGSLQGFAVLEVNGFQPRRTMITAVLGVMSIVHACFLAPPATMQRAGLVLAAGPDAGERHRRYLAAIVASVIAIALALFATPLSQSVAAVPPRFFEAMTGLVMFGIVLDALQRAFRGDDAEVAFVAFAITLSGASALGLAASFWGLAAGVCARSLRSSNSRPVAAGTVVSSEEQQAEERTEEGQSAPQSDRHRSEDAYSEEGCPQLARLPGEPTDEHDVYGQQNDAEDEDGPGLKVHDVPPPRRGG